MAHQRHDHIILSSPLWHKDILQRDILPDPPAEKLKELEQKFKLDCILVEKLRYKWSPDIIPKYDAQIDPYARHYFQSPMVQSLLRTTLTKDTTTSPRPKGSATNATRRSTDATPHHKHQGTPSEEGLHSSPRSSLNTLSGRRRAPPPPAATVLAERREGYSIDSVVATNQVTKYKPLTRPYDATRDWHARGYFQKPGVRKVLALTTLTSSSDGGKNGAHKDKGGCSIDGPVIDRFIESGAGYRYLHARNAAPGSAKAGHSVDQISGHGQFLSDAKPNFGFNGEFGYRRNSPWLRKMPSPFGVDPRSPTH